MTLTLTDRMELYALHRALMEAKFHADPDATEVQGSPYVATVSHRVLDALIVAEEAERNQRAADGWRDWRRGEQHDWLRRFVLTRLAQYPRLTPEQRIDYVRALTGPLIVDEAWVAAVIADAAEAGKDAPDQAPPANEEPGVVDS
ncbi:MAG TPA: hypothetical protein VFJ16_05225 [Longimicrobium sp.]|nr:hypothetical protein [Longimicrobium sp.]